MHLARGKFVCMYNGRPLYMLRGVAALAVLSFVAIASSRPWYLDRFIAFYQPAKGSTLAKAKCETCHDLYDGPPTRNAYGAQLGEWVRFPATDPDKGVTPDVMVYVENVDSDGDGYTNLEEIIAGTQPGDPDDHPSKHPTNLPHHKMSRKIDPLYIRGSGGILLLAGLLTIGGKAAKKGYMTKLGLGALVLAVLSGGYTLLTYLQSNRHP